MDEPLLPPEVHLTTDFVYFCWHGHSERIWFGYRYNGEQLDEWSLKIQDTAVKVKKYMATSTLIIMVMRRRIVCSCWGGWGCFSGRQVNAKDKCRVIQAQLGAFLG